VRTSQLLKKDSTPWSKFFGLLIDEMLPWKYHSYQLMYKLSCAYYTVRTVKAIVAQETLRMISFSYVHSIMTRGIIFWGNLPYRINIIRILPKKWI